MVEKYYLFRHGPTEVTNQQAKSGLPIHYNETNLSAPILPAGVQVLTKMGRYLNFQNIDGYFSSPLLRCRQTCEIIDPIVGKDFKLDERLAEDETQTLEQKEQRLKDFLASLERTDYKSVAICTHGTNLSILINLLSSTKKVSDPGKEFPRPGVIVVVTGGDVEEHKF